MSNLTWSTEVDCELQKAMYRAIELLKMLRRFYRDPHESAHIEDEITAVAQWIDFLTEQRDHSALEAAEQTPELLQFGARRVCNKCRQKANDAKRADTGTQVRPMVPPIWKTQREFLLACTQRLGIEVLAQQCASSQLQRFPECLAMLTRALLRQRKLLSRTDVPETKINVEHSATLGCAECGETIEPPSEMGS